MNSSKILGMIAAAKLQLEELEFNPREFLNKLEQEVNDSSLFEAPARTPYIYGAGFSSPDGILRSC